MEANNIRNLADRYREAITRRLWDQWTALGAGGDQRDPLPVTWAVDPEALILASSRLFSYEPRLRDAALAWCLANSNLVTIARLKRMQQDHSIGDPEALAEFAAALIRSSSSMGSWKSIASKATLRTNEGSPMLRLELVVPYDSTSIACLILKLRSLLGTGSRVEILYWMFYNNRVSISGMAKETCWYVKTVQKVVKEMLASGYVRNDSLPGHGQDRYYLGNGQWTSFFPAVSFPEIWLGQHHLYRGVFTMLDAMGKASSPGASVSVADFLLVESLRESFRAFQQARSYLWKETFDESISLEESITDLVVNAETSPNWPVGAIAVDPSRARFS